MMCNDSDRMRLFINSTRTGYSSHGTEAVLNPFPLLRECYVFKASAATEGQVSGSNWGRCTWVLRFVSA